LGINVVSVAIEQVTRQLLVGNALNLLGDVFAERKPRPFATGAFPKQIVARLQHDARPVAASRPHSVANLSDAFDNALLVDLAMSDRNQAVGFIEKFVLVHRIDPQPLAMAAGRLESPRC
jgi:hypothetical protein